MAYIVVWSISDCSSFTTHSLGGYIRRGILPLCLPGKLFLLIFRSYQILFLFHSVLSYAPLSIQRLCWRSFVRFLSTVRVCSHILSVSFLRLHEQSHIILTSFSASFLHLREYSRKFITYLLSPLADKTHPHARIYRHVKLVQQSFFISFLNFL
jgi:hypothetical protein